MIKYGFSIHTRSGQKVESIVIMGRDQADAERKLVQMYRHCTILRCEAGPPSNNKQPALANAGPPRGRK